MVKQWQLKTIFFVCHVMHCKMQGCNTTTHPLQVAHAISKVEFLLLFSLRILRVFPSITKTSNILLRFQVLTYFLRIDAFQTKLLQLNVQVPQNLFLSNTHKLQHWNTFVSGWLSWVYRWLLYKIKSSQLFSIWVGQKWFFSHSNLNSWTHSNLAHLMTDCTVNLSLFKEYR